MTRVDFVDIDAKTFNICKISLENKLKVAKKLGKLPKVLIVVHLGGLPCELEEIRKLSSKYKFKIIEDASHAFGAKYKSKPVGSCQFSDITVFSFHPVKIMTTVKESCTTNDKEIFEKIYTLRSHGIVRNQDEMVNKSHGSWYYEQIELGFNYRLNDLQSALGLSQIKRVDKFIKKRHLIAKKYDEFFKDFEGITPQKQQENSYSSFHLYIILVDEKYSETRKMIFEKYRNEGILVNVHYIPIYRHPFYSNNFNKEDFPNSEKYYSGAISFPIFPYLKKKQLEKVMKVFSKSQNYQNLF